MFFISFGVGFLFGFYFLLFGNRKVFNMRLEKYAVCLVTDKYQGLCLDCLLTRLTE